MSGLQVSELYALSGLRIGAPAVLQFLHLQTVRRDRSFANAIGQAAWANGADSGAASAAAGELA
jgi:hypothetical protein